MKVIKEKLSKIVDKILKLVWIQMEGKSINIK